ncbi:stage II sporulation protein P [Clostridium psychrophilum]|uniref:stage II sporulation protein P n=1 Tax=Clostridium psychrophilum TaxID=132926 RepID=UPI001C0E0236|nr:stage II sporulation protein P [Clostridium psychrophilum]MBU3180882.1 stage II sporulation protein P [Clostridium psychrophilum]
MSTKSINNTTNVKKSSFIYSHKSNKSNKNSGISFFILTILTAFLVCLIIPINVKAIENKKSNANNIYVNVIDNTMSVIKCFSNESQSANNEDVSINSFNLNNKDVIDSKTKVNNSNVNATLYDPDLKGILNNAKPRVLIYHSHTNEAYATSDKDKSKTDRSGDQTRNVVAVGDVITNSLEKNYGISVIHDKNVNDKPNYDKAYQNSGATLAKYIKKYGKFDLVIDLHRDSVVNKNEELTKINGQDVAQFMFVVTRQNPKYAKQKKLVDSMIGISNKLFSGLINKAPILYHDYGINFYNQGQSDNAMLIEVGTYTNSIFEVKNTGNYLSRIIAEQLNGKK